MLIQITEVHTLPFQNHYTDHCTTINKTKENSPIFFFFFWLETCYVFEIKTCNTQQKAMLKTKTVEKIGTKQTKEKNNKKQ